MPSFLRQLSGSPRTFLVPVFVLVFVTLCATIVTEKMLRGAVIDSENVCISVTVIGPDGGDPGTGCTFVPDVPSSSSSSSSSEASVSSSSQSSAASSSASQSSTPFGAYRYTRERSHWKIVRLLRQWMQRHTLHTAPEANAWYDEAVPALQKKGYVDVTDNLRLDASATRAETAKLIALYSGSASSAPIVPSFDDAIVGAWYVPFIERAAQHTWMIGYDNCYGRRPCIFRPAAIISRAEAAATFVRVFELYPSYTAPKFADVQYHAWYRDAIQAAADACIVEGRGGLVRPEDSVTRAELFVMFYRAMQHFQYGADCAFMFDAVSHPAPTADPSTMPIEEAPVCSASVPMCLFDALRADVGAIVQPFVASLLSFDMQSVRNIPVSEWLLWLAIVILPIGGISMIHCRRNSSHKPK